MRFLIDMNLSPKWVAALEKVGHSAVHWSTVGPADAADGAIADYARANGCVVMTNDLDFGKLLSAERTRPPSVIQLRLGDLRAARLSGIVTRTIAATQADLESGALVTIGTNKVRIAPLPVGGPEDIAP